MMPSLPTLPTSVSLPSSVSPITLTQAKEGMTTAISKRVVIGNIDHQTASSLADGLVTTTRIWAYSPFSWGVFFLGAAAFFSATFFGAAALIRGLGGPSLLTFFDPHSEVP